MQWSKSGPGSPSRRRVAFRPNSESLEERQLLATFDLSTTQTAPLGAEFVGKSSDNTAGFKVTDVGNVTGSGYDSFVVSAPGLPAAGIGNRPNFALAGESAAFLVFGSKQVNVSNPVDFKTLTNGTTNGSTTTLTAGQRAGDLGELGTTGVPAQSGTINPTAQTNPTVSQPQPAADSTHVYGFNFDGLTLVTGRDAATGLGRNSALGFSVTPLGDLNGDGFDDFAISAPNDAGGGRVFIIYGGTGLATQSTTNKTVDLEPTAGVNAPTTPTKVVTLTIPNSASGTDVGYSVAGIGNFFNTSTGRDLAIGVPNMSVNGMANAGAVFAISGTYLNSLASGTNVDLTTIGNGSNSIGGIEYTGTTAGALTGTSVATAGNTDGQTGSGRPLDNLLIGAPGSFGGGGAYLVYANQAITANSTRGTTQSLTSLGTAYNATTNPTPLQGIVFGDLAAGDRLGFAVGSAGDFNSDGVDDIALGAPGYNISAGYVYVAYGLAGTATATTNTRINGIFNISPTAASAGLTATSFIGQTAFDYTGYSLATTTHIAIGTTSNSATYDLLIGAPGANVDSGEAYLVPGTGSGVTPLAIGQQLSTISTALNGNLFNISGLQDPAILNSGFGTSVSARNPIFDANTLATTVDSDSVPDLFFGAPFSSLLNPTNDLTITRNSTGVAYVVEAGFIGNSSNNGGGGSTSTGTTTAVFPNAFGLLTPQVFTGDNFGLPYPTLTSLSTLSSYQPLSVPIAYQQFRPAQGFVAREEHYHHPSKTGNSHQAPAGTELNVAAIKHSEAPVLRVHTLPEKVRTRGKYKVGRTTNFKHNVRVIPASQQKESYPG